MMATNRKNLQAILFDFVGVLLFPKENLYADPFVDQVEAWLTTTAADEPVKARILAEYGMDEPSFQGVLERIVQKYEPFPALWKMLPQLRGIYKLAVINNGTRFTIPIFKAALDIDRTFDLFVNSAMEGVSKPDSRIYLLACKRLGVPPEQCLFMDDDESNVEAARATGMTGVWWKDRETGFQTFLDVIGKDF